MTNSVRICCNGIDTKHLGANFALQTVCPRSSDPFLIVRYYIKWITNSWTDGITQQYSFPQKMLEIHDIRLSFRHI